MTASESEASDWQHDDDTNRRPLWECDVGDAAVAAVRIGRRARDVDLDPALWRLVDAGEYAAEGFELAEKDLIEVAATGDGRPEVG
jgi:hypothetical protein